MDRLQHYLVHLDQTHIDIQLDIQVDVSTETALRVCWHWTEVFGELVQKVTINIISQSFQKVYL